MLSSIYYLQPDRLADVIRLIIVLACDRQSFRSESGLEGLLRGKPKSATSWLKLADEHPEFFRPNKEKDKVVLLIRFIQKVDVNEGELRDILTVDQTQKLVDQAIALHDKQLARHQQDSHKVQIKAAYIIAIATIIVGIFSMIVAFYSSSEIKQDIRDIAREIKKQKIANERIKLR